MGAKLNKLTRAHVKRVVREVTIRRVSYTETLDFAYQFYQAIDTPRSLSCFILLKHNEIDQLVSRPIHPNDYNNYRSYQLDQAATSLLKKFKFQTSSHPGWKSRTRDVALSTFYDCESSCRETNDRIINDRISRRTSLVLARARKIIRSILGRFDIERWLESCSFGPGVDYSNRRHATLYDKIAKSPTVGANFRNLGMAMVKSCPSWSEVITDFQVVSHNRVTFVPKDAKTDRPIAIEPTLNIYAQKGLGSMIRKRLKYRAGIDLNTQLANQMLALSGSVDNFLCTIDLKSASDTVSYTVVECLLPPDWFHALNATRSTHGLLPDGTIVEYEKFSSMGNGYTFELETLIFHALSVAVQLELGLIPFSSVYGDDIVCPRLAYNMLTEVFQDLGFTVNRVKSFHNSPFRESCGADFYDGKNVRPFHLKEPLHDLPSVYKAANSISRLAYFFGLGIVRDSTLQAVYWSLCSLTKRWEAGQLCVGSFISDEMGYPAVTDSHLSVHFSEALRRRVLGWQRDYQCWVHGSLRARPVRFRFEGRKGDFAVALYLARGSTDRATYGFVDCRVRRTQYSLGTQQPSEWYDVPGWS